MFAKHQQQEALFRLQHRTRRHFFQDCGMGLGSVALASLLQPSSLKADTAKEDPLTPKKPHFSPTAKRVIYLFMAGAPSQLDLFDYKPALNALEGKPLPKSIVGEQRFAFIEPDAGVLGPQFNFSKYGQSGAELSEMLPHLGKMADEVSIIKSVNTNQFNHAPAQIFLNTGSPLSGRPAMGAWATYGLGSESSDLPGFVVLKSAGGISGGAANWSAGFLPSVHAGVPFRSKGDPILNVTSPKGVDRERQERAIRLINDLNQETLKDWQDPEIQTRIDNYEMAYRMQSSAPELMDLSQENKSTMEMYGAEPGKESFANNCLLARRLVERGTRFIHLYHEGWDHHSNVVGGLKGQCQQTDQASAALLRDLKQRGLLEDTLVIWGGEFGRTAMVESNATLGRKNGRDHHPAAFTMWMAGGGIRKGQTLGETDELGYHVVKDPVHVHDLQATILHCLGLDHLRLTYRFKGRDFRLTDVHGNVVDKLLA